MEVRRNQLMHWLSPVPSITGSTADFYCRVQDTRQNDMLGVIFRTALYL